MRDPCWMRDALPGRPYHSAWIRLRHWWHDRHTRWTDYHPLDERTH